MKTLFLFLTLINCVAGPKADKVKQLAEIRNEILEKQRVEADKKYLAGLERLLTELPKPDLADQLIIQKEILKTKFLGTYCSKNRADYIIQICNHGIVYRPDDGKIGQWELVEENQTFVFKVTLGDWQFVLPADQKDNYSGQLFWKGNPDKADGLNRKK